MSDEFNPFVHDVDDAAGTNNPLGGRARVARTSSSLGGGGGGGGGGDAAAARPSPGLSASPEPHAFTQVSLSRSPSPPPSSSFSSSSAAASAWRTSPLRLFYITGSSCLMLLTGFFLIMYATADLPFVLVGALVLVLLLLPICALIWLHSSGVGSSSHHASRRRALVAAVASRAFTYPVLTGLVVALFFGLLANAAFSTSEAVKQDVVAKLLDVLEPPPAVLLNALDDYNSGVVSEAGNGIFFFFLFVLYVIHNYRLFISFFILFYIFSYIFD